MADPAFTPGTVTDPAAVAAAQKRESLIAMINANYDTAEQRAEAAASFDISPEELESRPPGLPNDPAANPGAQPTDTRISMEGAIADVLKDVDTHDGAAAAAAAADPQKAAAPAEEPNADLLAAQQKVVELQIQADLPADEKFREAALTTLKDEVAKMEEANARDDALYKQMQEDDPEQAEKMKGTFDESKALRAQNLQDHVDRIAEAGKANWLERAKSDAAVEMAVTAIPELSQWRDDANAAERGVPGKSGTMYEMARKFDEALSESEAWKDKSVAERFAKAVEMVKATFGAPLPGTPSAPNPTPTPTPATPPPPSSLSDIPGGQEPPSSSMATVEKLTEGQLHDLMHRADRPLTVDQIDHLAAQLEDSDRALV